MSPVYDDAVTDTFLDSLEYSRGALLDWLALLVEILKEKNEGLALKDYSNKIYTILVSLTDDYIKISSA